MNGPTERNELFEAIKQLRDHHQRFAEKTADAMYGFAHWLTVLSATTLTFLVPAIHLVESNACFLQATAVLHVASLACGMVVLFQNYASYAAMLKGTADYHNQVAEAIQNKREHLPTHQAKDGLSIFSDEQGRIGVTKDPVPWLPMAYQGQQWCFGLGYACLVGYLLIL